MRLRVILAKLIANLLLSSHYCNCNVGYRRTLPKVFIPKSVIACLLRFKPTKQP